MNSYILSYFNENNNNMEINMNLLGKGPNVPQLEYNDPVALSCNY